MAPVTIRHVAERAGVGVGTVSRVLNGSANVRGTTRERVLQAIEELDYRPSHAARQLATSKTFTLGVLLPFLTRSFFVEVLRGIEQITAGTPYHLVIYNAETPERRAYYLEEMPFLGRVDGLLIISLPLYDQDVARLAAAELPVVQVDEYHPAVPGIQGNNVAGGRMLVRHLLRLGHRRIAYICDEPDNRTNGERLCGYRHAVEEWGVPLRPEYVRGSGEYGRAAAIRLTCDLLREPEPPTAIFAMSDVMAMGALEAAQSAGVPVPGRLSVAGYDDMDLASYLGLTTVRQPMSEMGRQGIELLLGILSGDVTELVQRQFPIELIVRGTTGPPPQLPKPPV
jgi:DNA-binding LacI/PurR family transcriptional regulator